MKVAKIQKFLPKQNSYANDDCPYRTENSHKPSGSTSDNLC